MIRFFRPLINDLFVPDVKGNYTGLNSVREETLLAPVVAAPLIYLLRKAYQK